MALPCQQNGKTRMRAYPYSDRHLFLLGTFYISSHLVMRSFTTWHDSWRKVCQVLIRECCLLTTLPWLFIQRKLFSLRLISSFACACREFILTISLKKTIVLGQDISSASSISIIIIIIIKYLYSANILKVQKRFTEVTLKILKTLLKK